jgi:MFS family permease
MQSVDVRLLAEKYPDYIQRVARNYRGNFIVILLDSSFFTFATTILAVDTILPYFVSNLNSASIWIGVVSGLSFLGAYMPQIIGAYMVSGTATRKWAIFWIAVAERVGILMIALVAQSMHVLSKNLTLALFLVSYAVYAVTTGLIGPAYNDYISKNIIKNRGLFYGSMIGLGGVIGFAASLIVKHFLDTLSFPFNMQRLFWLGFIASFISPFLIAAYKETPYPESRSRKPIIDYLKDLPAQIKGEPNFIKYLVVRCFVAFSFTANAFYSIYAIHQYGLSVGTLAIFTMIILISQTTLGFLWGWLGDKFGYKNILAIALVLVALEAFLAITIHQPFAFYIICFCEGGAISAMSQYDPNMIYELAPPASTSNYVGVTNTLLGFVYALAPLFGGFLADAFSYTTLFVSALAISLANLVLTIVVVQDPRKARGASSKLIV